MRLFMAIPLATAAALVLGGSSSQAQHAAQLYPYCSLSSSSGATDCYIRSREECGRDACINNPWYIGRERGAPHLEGRKSMAPRYVRP